MQKVFLALQACNFFISCSMESHLVADWWWTVWFDILFTFSRLLNLHPCCRIRATKYVQRTIALYHYKLFNLFPFSAIEFCEVVMFKPWTQYVWSKSGILFFFLTTCATSFRIMTPYFTMLVNKYSTKEFVYLVLLLDHNALRFSLHLAEFVLKEIQKTKRSVIVLFLSSSWIVARLRFSLLYLCV